MRKPSVYSHRDDTAKQVSQDDDTQQTPFLDFLLSLYNAIRQVIQP